MADRPDPTLDDLLGERPAIWTTGDGGKGTASSHPQPSRRFRPPPGAESKRLFRPLVKCRRTTSGNASGLQFSSSGVPPEAGGAGRRTREADHDRLVYLEGLAFRGESPTSCHHNRRGLPPASTRSSTATGREVHDLLGGLGAALAGPNRRRDDSFPPAETVEKIARSREEHAYFELERRVPRHPGGDRRANRGLSPVSGSAADIGRVLDLGLRRAIAALLAAHGIPAEGVDATAQMVALCRERGLAAEAGRPARQARRGAAGSLGGVVSFHVIEHLPPRPSTDLVRPRLPCPASGGVLILETPNPLSLVVSARNFWLDPTHRRPVHPESLRLRLRAGGLRAHRADDHAPLPGRPAPAGDRSRPGARQRSGRSPTRSTPAHRIDELLFGFPGLRDVGTKPG